MVSDGIKCGVATSVAVFGACIEFGVDPKGELKSRIFKSTSQASSVTKR